MSIFFMLILFITASAFLTLLPVESREAQRTERNIQASQTAEAGIHEALTWLRAQLAPYDGSPSREPLAPGVYPAESARTRAFGNGWTYRWSLEADPQTYPNGSNPIRAYTIVSRSYFKDEVFSEARAEVIQESLTEYAALYDTWPETLMKGLESTDAPAGGKVHSNETLNFYVPEQNGFWNSSGPPIFDQGVTSTGVVNMGWSDRGGDGFGYYGGTYSVSGGRRVPNEIAGMKPFNSSGPIPSRYARMAEGGRDNVKSGVDEVPLPENTFALGDAAWGFDATNPLPGSTERGVHINETSGNVSGIYIEGDVEEMQLGYGGSQPSRQSGGSAVNYGQNSWVKVEVPINGQRRIDNNENVTVITVKEDPITLPAGTTLDGNALTGPSTINPGNTLVRRADGTWESYSGELNGSVYVNGDIRDLWGVNKGRRTIAVASDAGSLDNKIIIGGREPDNVSNSLQNGANEPLSTNANEKGLVQFGVVDADGDGILDSPRTADNTLGLIARDVLVSRRLQNNNRWNVHSSSNPLYIYATVMGGLDGTQGSYRVEDHDEGGLGFAYTYGSKLMARAGAWGTANFSGPVNGLTLGTSFFDGPASIQPPPFFPAKPSFAVKSYFELKDNSGDSL